MPVEFRIDASAFRKFNQDLKEFDPALSRSYRKRLKSIGDKGAEEMRKTVRLAPFGDRPGTRGSRGRIAKNTKVGISTGSRSAGVKITTRGAPTEGFAAAYNIKKPFRHPVFGNRNVWVEQQGRPYFGTSITKVLRARLQKEMSDAADDAFRAMKATKI